MSDRFYSRKINFSSVDASSRSHREKNVANVEDIGGI